MLKAIIDRVLHKIALFAPGGYTIRPFLHKIRGVKIGTKVWISQFVYIDELYPEVVTIGDNSSIGIRTSIIAHFYWGPKKTVGNTGPVKIGKDVFIGPHCVILPNVSIGNGAVIIAGTVVSQNVPEKVVWGPQKAGPIATATIPLTNYTSYKSFTKGLRQFRIEK